MGFSSPQDLNIIILAVSNNAACAVCIGNFPQNWLQKISFTVEYLSGCGLAHHSTLLVFHKFFFESNISCQYEKKSIFPPSFRGFCID